MSPAAKLSPTGTACLIGKKLISLAPHKRSPASSRFPWGAKTSQMGVFYPATPEIYNFPPEIPPNEPNGERTTRPPLRALFTSIYLCPQPLPNSPAILYAPALPSGTLGKSTTLPAQIKDPITNPNQPRHHGSTRFFWLVGNSRCGLIIWFRQVPGFHIEM